MNKEKIILVPHKTSLMSVFFIIGLGIFVLFNWSSIYNRFYLLLSPYQYYGEKLKITSLLKRREPYVFFGKVPVLSPHGDESFSFVFNDERVNESKPDNEFRILVVGGTLASGDGVSNLNERFYKVFETQLNQASKGINYRVFSAGVKDYVSGQILMQLQLGLLDFKPDMILYIDGYMDFFAHKVYAQPPGAPKFFLEYQKFLEIVWAIDTKNVSYSIRESELLKSKIKEKDFIDKVILSKFLLNLDIQKRVSLAQRPNAFPSNRVGPPEFNYHFLEKWIPF